MKKLWRAIALVFTFGLFVAATPAGNTGDIGRDQCAESTGLVLQAEEFDESAAGNYMNEITGTLHNTSSQSYDDVVVCVDYFNDQHVLVDSKLLKIRKDIEPGETESFSRRVAAPDDAAYAQYSIECAEHDSSLKDKAMFWD
jgi:hypothetical protein